MNYPRLAAVAKRLIAQNGRIVSLIKKSETPSDTTKPWRGTTNSPTTISASAVFSKYQTADAGNITRTSTDMATIAATDVNTDLTDFDFLVDGSITWKITKVWRIVPGNLDLLWKVELVQ